MITREREDYLKTIFKLQEIESPVRTTTLAEAMKVEPASVTGVVKRLSELKLVNYEPYKGVTLTETGEKIALEVIRHHRLIEQFLIEALGYSWDEVDAEAEELEHFISDRLEDRIADFLGHPEIDPHGSPIPSKEGVLQPKAGHPLTELGEGETATIASVEDDDPELLRYAAELGLVPGTRITVAKIAPVGGTIHLQVEGGDECVLGADVAAQIYVDST